MKEERQLANIHKIFCDQNDLYYLSKDNEKYKVFSDNFSISIEDSAQSIHKGEKKIYIILLNGKCVEYLINERRINILPFENVRCIHEKYIIYYFGNVFNRTFGVSNIEFNEILFESKSYIGDYFYKSFVFNFSYKKLVCKNIFDGNILWQKELNTYGTYKVNGEEREMDVQKYIGVRDGVLFIKAGYKYLLGFNIENGEETHKYEIKGNLSTLNNPFLDHKNGVIFSTDSKNYYEFDLTQSDYKTFDITETTALNKVKPYRVGGWEGNKLYFWEGAENNRFGVFNRTTKEIEWVGEIEEMKDTFNAIIDLKYGNGKIYVLDHDHTLHIYAEEIDEILRTS